MGNNKQSENNKRILSECSGETTKKNKLNTKLHDLTHGNLKSYLHRFKIIEARDCPCGKGNQTTEHVLYDCGILQEDRERLLAAVAKTDNWPINTDKLIKKHYKALAKFTKQVDKRKEIKTKKRNIREQHDNIGTTKEKREQSL
jgi:hypothetical protein